MAEPAVVGTGGQTLVRREVTEWARFRRVFFQRRLVAFSFVILCLLVVAAIFAPYLAPHDPYLNNLPERLKPPSSSHLLGTDSLGRDILSRLIFGARTALVASLLTVGAAAAAGMLLGLLAGYFGGWVEFIVMRLMDTLMCFPMLVLALLLAAVLGSGLDNVIIALSVATLPGYTRMMYAMTISVKENDYVLAARALGARNWSVMLRHLLPNALHPMIVLITSMLGNIILAEAALSFLGVGVTPPQVAWGSMVAEGIRYLRTDPMLSIAPGICIMLVAFAFNIVGDGLRDTMDPRLRGTL